MDGIVNIDGCGFRRGHPFTPHDAAISVERYGLDFGYSNDPSAIVAVYYYNGGYILDEKLYAKRLTNDSLATSIKLLPVAPIVADA